MKLKKLLEKQRLEEKKEAIASSPSTNMTLHYDPGFKNVGQDGKPEFRDRKSTRLNSSH